MNAINLDGWSIDVLIETLEGDIRPSPRLDRYIAALTNYCHDVTCVPAFTASIDQAVGLAKQVLPGWGWRVATCSVSDDAWVFPDFNSPIHGERLKRDVPMNVDWADMTDVDLRPAGREATALCIAVLRALSALKAKKEADTFWIDWDGDVYGPPTHWMPLPSPPVAILKAKQMGVGE